MSRRRGSRRAVACAALAILIGLPTTTRVRADDVPLRLVAQNVNVALDRQLRFVVAVDDPAALTDLLRDRRAALRIVLHRPVSTRLAVRDFAAGTTNPGAVYRDEIPLSRLDRGEQGELVALIPAGDLGRGVTPGLYPTSLIVTSSDGPVARIRTFVNLFDARAESVRMPVSVVIGLDTPPSIRPDGSFAIDAGSRSRLTRLLATLEGDAAPFSVLLPPELVDGLGELGDVDTLARLTTAAARHRILAAPYASVSPSSATSSEFVEQHDRGLAVLERLSPIERGVWFAARPVDAIGLERLGALGYDRIVLGPSSGDPGASNYARAYGVNGAGAFQLRVADPNLSAQLNDSRSDHVRRATTLVAEILAEQAEVVGASGDPTIRHVVIATVDRTPPDPAFLLPLGIALARAPQLAFVPLTASPIDPTGPTRLTLPALEDPDDASRIETLTGIRREAQATSSMLPADSPLRDEWTRSLLVAATPALSDGDFRSYIRGLRVRLRALRTAVRVPAAANYTLGGRESDIRIQVRNDSDVDLTVVVELRSAKLQFPEDPGVLTVPARSVSDLVVPVIARANGTFPLEVRLLTPEGALALGNSTVVTARVNALAGLGQLITGIALVLLASWWYSHWRRRALAGATRVG